MQVFCFLVGLVSIRCQLRLPRKPPMITSPRIYVGTYAKYNSGSIEGGWLDLKDFRGKFEFQAACQKLHGSGEHEFMFQDHEGIPAKYISESHLSDDVWDEWIILDDDQKELLNVFLCNVNGEGTLDDAEEAFQGKFASQGDWASDYWESTGLLHLIPENLRNYIDYEAYARDARLNGDLTFVEVGYRNVWVFNNFN